MWGCEKSHSTENGNFNNSGIPAEMKFDSAKKVLPSYYNLLKDLKSRGYKFMDFRTYWESDKNTLPEKLMVLRHDVHDNDIDMAYAAFAIEKKLLGLNSATYFVMWGLPEEINSPNQQNYLTFIRFLKSKKVDVQPHISPNDLYVSKINPVWGDYPEKKLLKLIKDNLKITKTDNGTEISDIHSGFINIHEYNLKLIQLLKEYNKKWFRATGIPVYCYAAHGSHTNINLALNNALILDQPELLNSGVYQFDTYNTIISQHLKYLSDNNKPLWMNSPQMIQDGRCQMLMHPKLWRNEEHFQYHNGFPFPDSLMLNIHL